MELLNKEINPEVLRNVLGSLGACVLLISVTAVIISRCSAMADPSSHGRGNFTEAEKQAMMTRSAPPREAMEAMAKMANDPSAGKVVSPWAKPQP